MLLSAFLFFIPSVLRFPFWPLEELFWLGALTHMLIWFIHLKKKTNQKTTLFHYKYNNNHDQACQAQESKHWLGWTH